MKFIALKTEDGKKKGRIAFCCKMLGVSRQGFYRYLVNRNRPWKYQRLAEIMREICSEDQCNDTYGRMRIYQALQLKKPDGVKIPGEKTLGGILGGFFSLYNRFAEQCACYPYIFPTIFPRAVAGRSLHKSLRNLYCAPAT